jgi:hypothetical protein
MKWLKNNKIYTVIMAFFVITNIFIIVKLRITNFDNDFSGGIEITLLKLLNISMVVIYFLGFMIAVMFNEKKRKLYYNTALASLIAFGILMM